MAVIVVARWKGDLQEAMPRVKEVGAFLKARGAVSVYAGTCHTGQHAGQVFTTVALPDWETFGTAHHAMTTDQTVRSAYAQVLQLLEVQERSIVVMEKL